MTVFQGLFIGERSVCVGRFVLRILRCVILLCALTRILIWTMSRLCQKFMRRACKTIAIQLIAVVVYVFFGFIFVFGEYFQLNSNQYVKIEWQDNYTMNEKCR